MDRPCCDVETLLFVSTQVQVCAAGALLNIQSPMLEAMGSQVGSSKESLGRLMTCVLTLSIVERCIAEAECRLSQVPPRDQL